MVGPTATEDRCKNFSSNHPLVPAAAATPVPINTSVMGLLGVEVLLGAAACMEGLGDGLGLIAGVAVGVGVAKGLGVDPVAVPEAVVRQPVFTITGEVATEPLRKKNW